MITLSHSLNIGKRTQRKTIVQTLSIYTNIISKKQKQKRGMLWKKLLETKRVTNAPLSNERWRTEKYLMETFNDYFVNIDHNVVVSISITNTTFQNYIHCDGPCLSFINLTDLKLEKSFQSLKTNKSSGYDDITADVVKKVSDEIFIILKHILNT